jgi:hypothetical protein
MYGGPGDPVGQSVIEIGAVGLKLEGRAMLTAQTVQGYVKARPFRPFRINMASGQTFDIRHPEMAKVLKSYLVIFKAGASDLDFPKEFETVSLMLTESISHLDASVA